MDLVRKQKNQHILPPIAFIYPSLLYGWMCQICSQLFHKSQSLWVLAITVANVAFFFFFFPQKGIFFAFVKLTHLRNCKAKIVSFQFSEILYSFLKYCWKESYKNKNYIPRVLFVCLFCFSFPVTLFFRCLGNASTSPGKTG